MKISKNFARKRIESLSQRYFETNRFGFCWQVLKLKQKIEAERGKEYPTESQKLIYAGKLL